MLKFTKSSSFYGVPVWEFNLPAGHTFPFAKDCRTLAMSGSQPFALVDNYDRTGNVQNGIDSGAPQE